MLAASGGGQGQGLRDSSCPRLAPLSWRPRSVTPTRELSPAERPGPLGSGPSCRGVQTSPILRIPARNCPICTKSEILTRLGAACIARCDGVDPQDPECATEGRRSRGASQEASFPLDARPDPGDVSLQSKCGSDHPSPSGYCRAQAGFPDAEQATVASTALVVLRWRIAATPIRSPICVGVRALRLHRRRRARPGRPVGDTCRSAHCNESHASDRPWVIQSSKHALGYTINLRNVARTVTSHRSEICRIAVPIWVHRVAETQWVAATP